uniref:Uncharacterized protein n=1 Tax=Ananas comosus var. bracteatus TaxID=296719 RepID=A0A6V7NW51_ANACO|nr:unnamed protein product [Ananas comosus var. bracteatus]
MAATSLPPSLASTILSSTVSISAHTRHRSIGFRRDLVRWNRDFETKLQDPCLLNLDKSLFELDRDTLHTRLGSAHECHSGVRLCAFALVSLMPVGLALHGPVSVDKAR